ncbi:MAG: zinc-dependent alcohol dehydrogenase family protein [Armatimonadota bacterium]|nr:zinc-dependent alcohol dehydrogenase family protein [Armatimonadota bacterium]MDR7474306.1 zinc-dependent alcohol dehydrogenase family protein [Armatimonadota bacterium]MDR7539916.1 zinc-dependent alcohol dehydrogenase family protein [Armatimonadota bacterium]
MRVQELHHPRPVEEEPLRPATRPVPIPGPGEVLLRVVATGVCHTDLHIAEGELPPRLQVVVPGHQVVGIVETAGPGVALPAGQRVGVTWLYRACGRCPACRRGEENLCPEARFTGYDVDGGYAEFMVADAGFVYPIPEAFSAAQAAPLLCAGVIGYRSLRKADVAPGERVGLFGFGASAHLAIQVARHWGCEVFVFTRSPEHRALAEELGAAWAGSADDPPPRPLDRAVLFAPAGGLIPRALATLRPGGTLAINAVYLDRIPEMAYGLLYGERTLRSVSNLTPQDAREFLALAAAIPLVTEVEVFPLEAANAALQKLKRREVKGAAVLAIGEPGSVLGTSGPA